MQWFFSLFRPRARLSALLISLSLASGCSPPPRTVEVVGRVTYNGVPVKGALVVFFGAEHGDDFPAAGATDANGHYELRTYFSAHDVPRGAVPNDYAVIVQKFKGADTRRVQERIHDLLAGDGDVRRYLANDAVHDLWPDGVPDGWPDGYVPTINQMPMHIFDDEERRQKLTRLERGIPLLPLRYSDPATSGLSARVERLGDGPLTFDFDLTGEIDENAPPNTTAIQFGLPE